MRTVIKENFAFILALIILLIAFNTKAQIDTCRPPYCFQFGNNDLYQIYGQLYRLRQAQTSGNCCKDNIVRITVSCPVTHESGPYNEWHTIGNNTLTPKSNFKFEVQNGIYELLEVYFIWGNSNQHVPKFSVNIYNNTLNNLNEDNTTPTILATDRLNKFQTSFDVDNYLDYNGQPLQIGRLSIADQNPQYVNNSKSIIEVRNGFLVFHLISHANTNVTAETNYKFILKLKKLD